eukprot:6198332-Pleurochrysis_carterae.AAC.1
MARSSILSMVSIIVATGTTLNLAADWIHPIGSWGISHYLSISVDRCKALPMTHFGGLSELICITIVSSYSDIGSKLLSQSVISRYPSKIAMKADYLAFCPRDPVTCSSTLGRAFIYLQTVAAAPHLSCARTCEALALRFPSSWIPCSRWSLPPRRAALLEPPPRRVPARASVPVPSPPTVIFCIISSAPAPPGW